MGSSVQALPSGEEQRALNQRVSEAEKALRLVAGAVHMVERTQFGSTTSPAAREELSRAVQARLLDAALAYGDALAELLRALSGGAST